MGNNAVNYTDPSGLFQSPALFRALVPGQVAWDNALTSFENGNYALGGMDLLAMVGEQALFAASFGQSGMVKQGGQCAVEKGKAVLGHYPEYVSLADKVGGKRFTIPEGIWNQMTASEQWSANQKFLDRAIKAGREFLLATQYSKARPGSFYEKELQYLLEKGYQLDKTGTKLIP